jgi:hypothetical protein
MIREVVVKMIKPEEIKIISSVAENSSFYFIKENVLFLFECTEETIYWLKTFTNSFKDLKGAVVTTTLYNATLEDNTYLKELNLFFSNTFGKNFDVRYNLATKFGNNKPVLKKIYPISKNHKITLEFLRDVLNERMDVIIYENYERNKSIYYSGMNYGRRLSEKLDREVMNVGYLASHHYHSIINLYNKYFFYNIFDLDPVILWEICSKILGTPMKSSIIGLPTKSAMRYFDKRIKESGMVSFLGAGPENQKFEKFEMFDTGEKDLN